VAEVRIVQANDLPTPNDTPETNPKAQELREVVLWSEGQLCTSPERHSAMSAMKAPIH